MTINRREQQMFFSNFTYERREQRKGASSFFPFVVLSKVDDEGQVYLHIPPHITLKTGINYHLHIQRMERGSSSREIQGVDLKVRRVRGEKIVFSLSHRLKKLFNEGEKVKVTIFGPSEEFYAQRETGEKEKVLEEYNDEIIYIAFLFQEGKEKEMITYNSQQRTYLENLEGVKDAFKSLEEKKIRREEEGAIPFEVKSYTHYATVLFFTLLKKYDHLQTSPSELASYYSYFEEEKKIVPAVTTVKVCLLLVINKRLVPLCLEEKMREEINLFLSQRIPLSALQNKLYELRRVILHKIREAYRPTMEEEVYNEYNIQSMLANLHSESAPIYHAIMSLVSFDNYVSVEEIVDYVKERYKIKDKGYISRAITDLINKGIIERKNVGGKVGLGVVDSYDEKR